MGHGPSGKGGASVPKKESKVKLSEKGKTRLGDAKDRLREIGYKLKADNITEEEADYLEQSTRLMRDIFKDLGITKENFSNMPIKEITIDRKRDDVAGGAEENGNFFVTSKGIESHRASTIVHEMIHTLMFNEMYKQVNALPSASDMTLKEKQKAVKDFYDGSLERQITQNAFDTWKSYHQNGLKSQIEKVGENSPKSEKYKTLLAKINDMTHPYEAAEFTGMRAGATKEYPSRGIQKGAGIEIPPIAVEEYIKHGLNKTTLRQKSSYAYFVLQEMKKTFNKKK